MHARDVSVAWLQSINYHIQSPYIPATIQGVAVKDLEVNLDGRGHVIELWSKPWIKDHDLVVPEHVYQSATDYGVVKSWHLNSNHTNQLTVTRGKMQICLVDIRPESPSFGHVNRIFLGDQLPRLIKVPPMVLHGLKALTQPEVIVVNLQSHPYDPEDEFKFPWDCVLHDIWEPKNG